MCTLKFPLNIGSPPDTDSRPGPDLSCVDLQSPRAAVVAATFYR